MFSIRPFNILFVTASKLSASLFAWITFRVLFWRRRKIAATKINGAAQTDKISPKDMRRENEDTKRKRQTACKPGSVRRRESLRAGGTAIPLGRALRRASCDQPERRVGNVPGGLRHLPPLFGLAPGGVYPAAPVAGRAVRSYRTISPLPAAPDGGAGGMFSVALSLRSPPPAVGRHRVPVEPGLSSRAGLPARAGGRPAV